MDIQISFRNHRMLLFEHRRPNAMHETKLPAFIMEISKASYWSMMLSCSYSCLFICLFVCLFCFPFLEWPRSFKIRAIDDPKMERTHNNAYTQRNEMKAK